MQENTNTVDEGWESTRRPLHRAEPGRRTEVREMIAETRAARSPQAVEKPVEKRLVVIGSERFPKNLLPQLLTDLFVAFGADGPTLTVLAEGIGPAALGFYNPALPHEVFDRTQLIRSYELGEVRHTLLLDELSDQSTNWIYEGAAFIGVAMTCYTISVRGADQ